MRCVGFEISFRQHIINPIINFGNLGFRPMESLHPGIYSLMVLNAVDNFIMSIYMRISNNIDVFTKSALNEYEK